MSRLLPASAGVIGWPVAHSKSPLIHRFWLRKLGIDGDYGRFPVDPAGLGAAIRALPMLGLRGVNVTVPHKVAVIGHLDDVDAAARAVGAVNTVVVAGGRLAGSNTDVAGILEPLAAVDLAGRDVVVIGGGGAARAVLAALRSREVGRVAMFNRDHAKAAAMLVEFGLAGTAAPLGPRLPPAALVINASTLGMAGAPLLDVDLGDLAGDATVFDAVYVPRETALLAAARARGLPVIDGLAMLIAQAAAAFALFFDAAAPRAHDAELRAALTA